MRLQHKIWRCKHSVHSRFDHFLVIYLIFLSFFFLTCYRLFSLSLYEIFIKILLWTIQLYFRYNVLRLSSSLITNIKLFSIIFSIFYILNHDIAKIYFICFLHLFFCLFFSYVSSLAKISNKMPSRNNNSVY